MTKIPDINLNQNLWALVFSLVAYRKLLEE
jgi:hypothetical protein